jgi:hypothetical protein
MSIAERLHRFRRHPRGIFLPRNIDLQSDGLATLRCNLLYNAFAVENVGDDKRRALRGEPATIGGADVPRSTGDDGDLTTQPQSTPGLLE